jgi:iron complex outermembrane receptor protein
VLNYGSIFQDGFYNDTGANFTETTPMISLTRNVGDDGMVYGLISKGFLSGSFNDELNINLVPELAPLLAYDPETVVNYELGFKGSFADGRVRIAADVFYMDYKDKQETVNIDNFDGRFGGDPDVQITTNAATVEITGIEFELRAALWDGGFISLDVGWLDDEFSDFFSIDPNDPGNPIDLSNTSRETYSADWTINASIEHAFLLGNGATLTPQLGIYWQDDYDFFEQLEESPPSFCNQPAYAKLRARVSYVPDSGSWQASLFGNNITDKQYFEWCDDGRSGTYAYRYGPPSQWGLEFNYSWGN